MKKVLALMLSLILVLSLASCGTTEKKDDTAKSGSNGSKSTYKVGIVQLVQHPALDAATKGFKDALTKKLGDKVVFDVKNASGDSATCSTIVGQFVSGNYDLILANATPALQAAASATNKIPILGTSITHYGTALDIDNWTGTTGINVSGTSDLAPLDKQAEMIKELYPNAKKVGILYCSAEANSKFQSTTIQKYLKDLGFESKEYTFADSNDVASVTKAACTDSDVIYIPTDNTAASCAATINNVAEPAKVPIIAGEEGICKGCGVATLSISYYDLGYTTGEMAYEVLANGADISKMEIKYAPKFTYEYMADRAEKLGVKIPSNYEAIKAK